MWWSMGDALLHDKHLREKRRAARVCFLRLARLLLATQLDGTGGVGPCERG